MQSAAQLNLTLFAHVCARPEDELDLAEAALLIAESEQPGLDVRRYIAELDELGRGARAAVEWAETSGEVRRGAEEEGRIEHAVLWLYDDAGFHGNEEEYYDPRNSFLNEVIERRSGIPITLAVVIMEVCRRAGLDVRGVSFPGHFLARGETPRGPVFIDPFTGRMLGKEEVRALYTRATGDDREPIPRILEPATKSQILLRMLNNLRSIYAGRSDVTRLRGVLERMLVLAPNDELRREIERLGGTAPFRSTGRGIN